MRHLLIAALRALRYAAWIVDPKATEYRAQNGDGRPREAAAAHTHVGGTPREHSGSY